jgi:hypothetical protein
MRFATARRPPAIVAHAGAAVYVLLLAVLHLLQPHLIDDATISKYALGQGGWLLQAAFVSAGVGYAGVARLLPGRASLLAWLTAAAFCVMGAFRIDSVGPSRVVSVHGALHTAAFFVVVVLAHWLMFLVRSRSQSTTLRALPFVAPVLVVVGFVLPGLVGALIFRAWTLSLVVWVVLTAASASLRSVDDADARRNVTALSA